MRHRPTRKFIQVGFVILFLAAPLAASQHFKVKKGNGGEFEVAGGDQTSLKNFHYTPNNASITIGTTTFAVVFEKDGSVTFNGVNAKSNDELLGVIARSGLALRAAELDEFIGMLQSGEVSIEPKKRGDSFLQLLMLWRSRM